jgi:hypothetical protein
MDEVGVVLAFKVTAQRTSGLVDFGAARIDQCVGRTD